MYNNRRGNNRYGGGNQRGGGNRNGGSRRRRFTGQQFNESQFINRTPQDIQQKEYTAKNSFLELDLDPKLLANIVAMGYEKPTPIQDQTIPHTLEGKDVIGLANTGTGKTAAFLIPLINRILNNPKDKVLIIAPTRELALQIDDAFYEFTKGMNLYSVPCIGGANISKQISWLRQRFEFVIGTPGRLMDLEERRVIDFSQFTAVILDEVDRMLDMGFVNDIKYILSKLPASKQCLFFSATLSPAIKDIIHTFTQNPVQISVLEGNTSKNVYQDIIPHTRNDNKADMLRNLMMEAAYDKVLVFAATKRMVETLSEFLNDNGVPAHSIHGNKSQFQRERSLMKFKSNQVKVLVATDVAARGLDISDVSHVINYDLPQTYEDYVHRIGRTGRAGKKGIALTFFEK